MHDSIKKLIHIEKLVKSKEANLKKSEASKIIAVSKTFSLDKIMPLINHGHYDYGENKVQEAMDKWTQIKAEKPELKLHLLGKLQTNKVKFAIKLFDFIHSVDSKKLAKKIYDEQLNQNKKLKLFLQVNIGHEKQKFRSVRFSHQKLLNQFSNMLNYAQLLSSNLMTCPCLILLNLNFYLNRIILEKKDLDQNYMAEYTSSPQYLINF